MEVEVHKWRSTTDGKTETGIIKGMEVLFHLHNGKQIGMSLEGARTLREELTAVINEIERDPEYHKR